MPRRNEAEEAFRATIGELATRTQKDTLAGGREVVQQSAPLWRRVTDGAPCGWCAMLASRGPVYGSAAKAGQGRRYHGHCGCTAEPFDGSWDDWEPTPEEQRYETAYAAVHEPGMTGERTAALMDEWMKANPYKAAAEAAVRRQDGFDLAPLLRVAPSVEDAVGKANPLYSTGAREYAENCGNCSVAFEARMRGYDVTAVPRTAGRNGMSISTAFRRISDGEPPRFTYMKGNGKTEMAALAKDASIPVGARGMMGANWKGRGAGGHFWVWEKTAGGIRFYDAQTGKTDVLRYLNLVRPGQVGWVRLDDCEFVGDLSEWVTWG